MNYLTSQGSHRQLPCIYKWTFPRLHMHYGFHTNVKTVTKIKLHTGSSQPFLSFIFYLFFYLFFCYYYYHFYFLLIINKIVIATSDSCTMLDVALSRNISGHLSKVNLSGWAVFWTLRTFTKHTSPLWRLYAYLAVTYSKLTPRAAALKRTLHPFSTALALTRSTVWTMNQESHRYPLSQTLYFLWKAMKLLTIFTDCCD